MDVKGTKITPYDLALKLWETIPEGRDNGPQSSGLKVIVKGERDGKKIVYTADMVGRMAPRNRASRIHCITHDGCR